MQKRLDKVTAYLRRWEDFLSSRHEVFGFTGHEPYLREKWFKNRSVEEGNVWATKSNERKHRYVELPDKGTLLKLKMGMDQIKMKLHMHVSLHIWCTGLFLTHQIGLFSFPAVLAHRSPSSVNQALRATHVRTCVGLVWGGCCSRWKELKSTAVKNRPVVGAEGCIQVKNQME